MKNLFTLIALWMNLCLFTQNIKPTQNQKEKIEEIFTPEYIIESSKTISIYHQQDSVIKVRDIQIKELQDKIEALKNEHKNTLIEIAKQNNIAKEASKDIDSINNELKNKIKFQWSGLHLYGGLEILEFKNIESSIPNLELMYELKKIEFGIRSEFRTEIIVSEPKYRFNYFLKVRYKFF